MANKAITPFACPACKDETLVSTEINEELIVNSKRFPVMMTTKCPNGHSLVLFIDSMYGLRDVEAVGEAAELSSETKERMAEVFDKAAEIAQEPEDNAESDKGLAELFEMASDSMKKEPKEEVDAAKVQEAVDRAKESGIGLAELLDMASKRIRDSEE